jgi:hypothetical protein
MPLDRADYGPLSPLSPPPRLLLGYCNSSYRTSGSIRLRAVLATAMMSHTCMHQSASCRRLSVGGRIVRIMFLTENYDVRGSCLCAAQIFE